MSDACTKLHQLFNRFKRLHFPFDINDIPRNGIYVLFEKGERAHGADRIVRVGTHTGDNQLRSRLHQHFVKENKDRSIFRKNIGRSLLARSRDPFLEQWELDLTTRAAKQLYSERVDQMKLKQVERKVTEYLQHNLSFVAFEVADKADRLLLESRIISTVSLCTECRTSSHWLGLDSPKQKIRESSLWLVNELYKQPFSEAELTQFLSFVAQY